MLGDIGGLVDFIVLILTPIIFYIVGDRFSYIILKSLYMQNRVGNKVPDFKNKIKIGSDDKPDLTMMNKEKQ